MTLDEIYKINQKAVVWDGLNEAIIGIATKELNGPIIVTLDEASDMLNMEIFDNEDETYDRWGRREFGPIVVYDIDKIVEILSRNIEVDENNLTYGDSVEEERYAIAYEYFEYNIDGAWVGEFTPIHININEEEED